MRLAATFALLSLHAASPSYADVLTVDAASGPYFEIRAAVAAASSGDVIRVHAGRYGYFGVFGKELAIAAAGTGAVIVEGGVRVQNVAAGDVVQLDGLTIEPASSEALIVADCAGAVRVSRCSLRGSVDASGALSGLRVERADDVALTECSIAEWVPATSSAAPQRAAVVTDSIAAFHACTVSSRNGVTCTTDTGGYGLVAIRSSVAIQGCAIQGGDGGFIDDWICGTSNTACGDGGHAVVGIDSSLVVHGSTLVAGRGAHLPFIGGCAGYDGRRISLNSQSTVVESALPAPALSASAALVDEGSEVRFAIDGAPGDVVYLLASTEAQSLVLPGASGHLLITAPNGGRRVLAGTVPAGGGFTWSWIAPDLAPLVHLSIHVQSGHYRAGTGVVLGPAQVLQILDSGL